MKKFFLLFCFLAAPAFAQPTPGVTNFKGEKQELRAMFSTLWSHFKEFDAYHCYRRAHVISFQMSKMGYTPEKVFYFRGDLLSSQLNWWYHVAPMVYYHDEPVVVDRGLLQGATRLEDWLLALSEGKTCREIKSMNEYREHLPTEYCMYLKAPMYYYAPDTLESLNRTGFEQDELNDMIVSISVGKRARYLGQYPTTLDEQPKLNESR